MNVTGTFALLPVLCWALLATSCSSQEAPGRDGGGGSPGGNPVDAAPAPRALDAGPDGSCGVVSFISTRLAPEILLVMDRSSSMGDPSTTGPPSKWALAVGAVDGLVAQRRDVYNWGLEIFGDGVTACGAPDRIAVPIGPLNDAPIAAALTLAGVPGGAPPRPAAITAAGGYLRARSTPNPKLIVLVTDGLATCAGADAQAPDDGAASQAISDQLAAGIATYVIGVPTEGDTAAITNLNQMAAAGIGKPTSYLALRDVPDFFAPPFESGDRSCTFTLPAVPPAPSNVKVELNGATVPQDSVNGWRYSPGYQSIVLSGGFCDAVLNDPSPTVRVLYGCPLPPIP